MTPAKGNPSGSKPGHIHQPTVTRADLYDKGERILKDTLQSEHHLKSLKKTVKKIKKRIKQRRKEWEAKQ
jgi:hypothetical protein